MKILYVTITCLFVLLVGCAPRTTIINHEPIEFKGDTYPIVLSSAALKGDLSNLSEGETLIVAVAKDGSGAISQPNTVGIEVQETVLVKKHFDPDLMLQRCDTDGDGIIDVSCPNLVKTMDVAFQSYYMLQSEGFDHDFMVSSDGRVYNQDGRVVHTGTAIPIDVAEATNKTDPFYLKLVTINRGNKTFEGDLSIYANIPSRVKLLKITKASKVEDRSDRNVTLNVLAYLTLVGGILTPFQDDNINEIDSNADFSTVITQDGNIKLTVKDIKLEPGEGVTLDYTVVYNVP